MISNKNQKLRINDKIYHICWKVIDNNPTWFYEEYMIKDMYYSDACYVILESSSGFIMTKQLNDKNLLYSCPAP